jgi:uncharacterized repeat protein (TIGR03803 family)
VLYGTTKAGGAHASCQAGCGIVYSLTPPSAPGGGWIETILYTFAGGTDSSHPSGGVIVGETGALFGTTTDGGTAGLGTVFSLTPPISPGGAWIETILHSFTGADGANPLAGVIIGPRGELYGTTSNGGTGSCTGGRGTVFELQ